MRERMASIMTRRSKGCERRLGSTTGGADGLDEARVTVPVDWGFMTKARAVR